MLSNITITGRKPSTQNFLAASPSNHWQLRRWVLRMHDASSMAFVAELVRRLSESTDDPRETAFLFQRLSVAVQRFNAVLIQKTFDFFDGRTDLYSYSSFFACFQTLFLTLGIYTTEGKKIIILDGHGRARREAARRRKSECKINSGRRNSSRSNFSEHTSTIPEVMDSSTLNFNPNF